MSWLICLLFVILVFEYLLWLHIKPKCSFIYVCLLLPWLYFSFYFLYLCWCLFNYVLDSCILFKWFTIVIYLFLLLPYLDHFLMDTSTLTLMSNLRCNEASHLHRGISPLLTHEIYILFKWCDDPKKALVMSCFDFIRTRQGYS